jgi:hypothetical protein
VLQTWTMTGAVNDNSPATGINLVGTYTFPVGVTNIQYYIEDAAGNSASCSFSVTVTDNQNPIAICQDITIYLDPLTGLAIISPSDIDGGSTDNCGIESLIASQTEFNCTHLGDNLVTLTVRDFSGNESTCIATVTVEYSLPPVIDVIPLTDILCNEETTNIELSSNITATTFNWTVDDLSGGQITGFSDGNGGNPFIINQTLTNSDNIPHTIRYIITPRIYNLCDLPDVEVEIIVEPTPVVTASPVAQTICDGGQTDILLTTPTHQPRELDLPMQSLRRILSSTLFPVGQVLSSQEKEYRQYLKILLITSVLLLLKSSHGQLTPVKT